MAPSRFFNRTSAFFLPLGSKGKLISRFEWRGGTRHRFVRDKTDYIVAENWEQVVDHFSPYPGLLKHFYSLHVNVVSYEWLSLSLEKEYSMWWWEYNLKPRPRLGEPGSESQIRKMSLTGSESPTSSETGFIMSPRREKLVVAKYELDIVTELETSGLEPIQNPALLRKNKKRKVIEEEEL